ncbi:MAG: hypothetical protein M0Z28_24605 [Rhodospirillales bacterium]|nr:hypothetical protein [Rhodospirillales bacterium]
MELLRNGWITANVNTSIKNAADYDLFALKRGRWVSIRVKACHFTIRAFQFNFRNAEDIIPQDLAANDFSIMVNVGCTRDKDEFYIVPTLILRGQIKKQREFYLSRPKRDGGQRKDDGHWALHLDDMKSDPDRYNCGYAMKWKDYRNAWPVLDADVISATA